MEVYLPFIDLMLLHDIFVDIELYLIVENIFCTCIENGNLNSRCARIKRLLRFNGIIISYIFVFIPVDFE